MNGALPKIPRLSAEAAIPLEEGEPVFQAPWEARVFAMTLFLCDQGQYTWKEFQELLIDEITSRVAPGQAGADSTPPYYEHWLSAFEQLLGKKGVVIGEHLETRAAELASSPSRYDDHEDADHDHDDHAAPEGHEARPLGDGVPHGRGTG